MLGVSMTDVRRHLAQRTRHGIEFIIVTHEILMDPAIGVTVAGHTDAKKIFRADRRIDYLIGVLAVGRRIQPMHLTVLAESGFAHGIAGNKMEQRINTEKLAFGFKNIHGLTDVIAVGGCFALVDFQYHIISLSSTYWDV
jgi:hypothetical protein